VEPKFLPADGVYAGWVHVPGDPAGAVRGAISLGLRPTFDGAERTLEVHLIDWSKVLRDKILRVEFTAWLRGQEKFEGPEALVEAMGRDVARCRAILDEDSGNA
jgi:riboflavin kinase/FMN adenylyltransferase